MQWLFDGLVNGAVLALLGLAILLVYYGARVFHIALGASYTLAPFVASAAFERGAPRAVAAATGIIAATGFSILCEVVNHRPLQRRQSSWTGHMVASLGTYIAASQVITMVWGNEVQVLGWFSRSWRWESLVLSEVQLFGALCSAVILTAFFAWLRTSGLGLRIRGLADDPEALALRGINISGLRILLFGLAGALAGVSSMVRACDVGFEPTAGLNMTFLAFAALVVGGRNAFSGALVGSFILCLVRSFSNSIASARWESMSTFLVVGLFLIVWPYGVVGRASIRVEPA